MGKSHTNTSDLLTWSEASPPLAAPAPSLRSRQPSDGFGRVVFGGQVTDEEHQSLMTRLLKMDVHTQLREMWISQAICPPRVLPSQWPALVAYWRSDDAQFDSGHHDAGEDAGEPKTAPSLPPTPLRPSENIMPQVKLLGELDFGDVSRPVQNYNHTRSQRYVSISPTHSLRYSVGSEDWTMDSAASYGSFITEEKITQKKEEKPVAAAADMGLSGTPVRRNQ